MAHHPADRPNVFPCFKYRDAPAAIEWLGRAFGFTPALVVPGKGGTVVHAELRNGAGMIMCGSATLPDPADPWSAAAFGIYVRVDDVDARHARAVAAGAQVVRPPVDTDYGAREYSVRDLEGRLWSFGDYDPYAPR
ncbi:MAG TPA: VOC family protein [Thalassobaculum sp.]